MKPSLIVTPTTRDGTLSVAYDFGLARAQAVERLWQRSGMATKSTSIAERVRSPESKAGGTSRKRAEQQRSQSTRATILEAALAEFAETGFEPASIRRIAERTGFQHPLITYHYPSKDLLWQAVAEDTFERIRREWDECAPQEANLSPVERLRAEYRALFRHTATFPEFHRFMRQEAATDNSRLHWVAENVLKPLITHPAHLHARKRPVRLPARGDSRPYSHVRLRVDAATEDVATTTICAHVLKACGGGVQSSLH